MPLFTFRGPVFPRHLAFAVDEVTWTYPNNNGHKTAIAISFTDHEIRAVCNSTDPHETHLNVYPIARECSQAFASYLTYVWEVRITFIIETVELDDGTVLRLVERLRQVETESVPFVSSEEMRRMFTDPDIALALQDFATAHETRHLPAVHYARALDAIRVKISPGETNDKRSWENMHTVLRLSESYLKYVTDRSRLPRHGQRRIPSEAENTEMMERTRTVIDRYVEYVSSGVSLPATFPVL